MGKSLGFFGNHGVAFVVMVCVVKKMRPKLFVHENTRAFDVSILSDLLPEYHLHHWYMKPEEFGCPASRTRSYSALVRGDHDLVHGMEHFFRMSTLTSDELDCGSFLIAPEAEAHPVVCVLS